jgi:hypothetical protein
MKQIPTLAGVMLTTLSAVSWAQVPRPTRSEPAAGTASTTAPSATTGIAPSAVAGSWFLRNAQFEMRVEFTTDGRFTRSVRTATASDTGQGTWKLTGDSMELRVEGEPDVLKFTVKMPDTRTLELWESEENGKLCTAGLTG